MIKQKEERSFFMVPDISVIITGDGGNSWVAVLDVLLFQ